MAVRAVYVQYVCVWSYSELGWVPKSELGIVAARLFTGWTPFLYVTQPAALRH